MDVHSFSVSVSVRALLHLAIKVILSAFLTLSSMHLAYAEPTDSTLSLKEESEIALDERATSILRHHPFYFVYGDPLSKLQLSFKVPIVREVPFYFGFTQLMFWAIEEESKTFRDLTYNPELFYRWSDERLGLMKSVDFGLWSHNSNGREGEDSRSYEKNYLRLNFEREAPRWVSRLSLQFSYLHALDYTNHDITEYISPLAINLSFRQLFDSWVDKSEISIQASPGGKLADRWSRGGYQFSWSFRPGRLKLVPAIYFQYYQGFAETLLNYDEKVSEFRGGVIF